MPWLGTKTNMTLAAGDLQLDAGAEEGSYLLRDPSANPYIDTGVVGRYRINVQFNAEESGGVTADDSNEIEVKLEIDLATAAGPSWLGWRPYLPGEYYCQWYRVRATVKVDDAFGNRPKFLRFEHNHVRIGSIPMAASVDDLKTAPTGTEPQGTRYIVIATATGDFTGKEDQISELVETTDRIWEFAIPVDRQEVYNLNGGWKYRYEGTFPAGSWVPRGLNVSNPEEDKFVGGTTVVGAKNYLWNTDGGGDIGASGANRPDYVHAKTGMTINGVTVVAGAAPSPHLLGGPDHGADTLANLNSKISFGNLDFDTASRPPTAHKNSHKSGGGDPFGTTDLLEAIVKRLQVTGPVTLLLGAVADGEFLKRSGTALLGADPVPSTSKVRAYLSANQNILTSTLTIIQFDTETYDVLGDFNTGTYRFVAPVTGYYLVQASLWLDTVAVNWRGFISRNGTTVSEVYWVGSSAMDSTMLIHDVVYMTASQYLEIKIYQSSGSTQIVQGGQNQTHLEVVRLL
jgi:hypothetical protein